MNQIIISNGTASVTMPVTDNVNDAGELVYKETTMASGKNVRDIRGFRQGYKYTWDYIPADIITSLITLLRTGTYFTVDYFDVNGTAGSGSFSISYPAFEVFKFVRGTAMWHNCSITIKAQGVV